MPGARPTRSISSFQDPSIMEFCPTQLDSVIEINSCERHCRDGIVHHSG
jgi:hypothetical protein